jgi:hypothetical protein
MSFSGVLRERGENALVVVEINPKNIEVHDGGWGASVQKTGNLFSSQHNRNSAKVSLAKFLILK